MKCTTDRKLHLFPLQEKSAKIRLICGIRVPFKRVDPNQSLQLTAGRCGFMMFLGLWWVLVCRTFFGKPPPQLNLGR